MNAPTRIHYQAWGKGPPVLALHGLGLESSSFTGLARSIAGLGLRMLAADLPGFGRTPAPAGPLTPEALAEPVIALARRLDSPPLVMGMSLGARVALEAALREPGLFRGAVMMAPPLPWTQRRWALVFARLMSPSIAERIPIERAWPRLQALAARLEKELSGADEHNWAARASTRAIYYISCPATRRAFVSAARELALDPAFGPRGLWTRLGSLGVPAAFVWGDKDRFIPRANAARVAEQLPSALQVHVPCAGHHDNGPHFHCLEQGAVEAVMRIDPALHRARRRARQIPHVMSLDCRADAVATSTALA